MKKSLSQSLRDYLWAMWKALDINLDFDEFYRNEMENLIEDKKGWLAKDKTFMEEQKQLAQDYV